MRKKSAGNALQKGNVQNHDGLGRDPDLEAGRNLLRSLRIRGHEREDDKNVGDEGEPTGSGKLKHWNVAKDIGRNTTEFQKARAILMQCVGTSCKSTLQKTTHVQSPHETISNLKEISNGNGSNGGSGGDKDLRSIFDFPLGATLTLSKFSGGIVPDVDAKANGAAIGSGDARGKKAVPKNVRTETRGSGHSRAHTRYRPTHDYSSDVEVRKSGVPDAGRGVFARRDFAAGQVVGTYVGVAIDQKEALRMDAERVSKVMTVVDAAGRASFVDAHRSTHFSAFLNHKWREHGNPGGAANLQLTREFRLQCLRDIRRGEELFIDYGVDYWVFQQTGVDARDIADTAERARVISRTLESMPNFARRETRSRAEPKPKRD